jgi:hypothetical protein
MPATAGGEPRGVLLPRLDDLVDPADLRDPHGGLEVGHPVVVTGHLVLVPLAHALVAQDAQPVGDGVVVGRDHAALTGGEVLGGVEGERSDPERAGTGAVVGRTVGLRRVLHDVQAAVPGDGHERVHVGGLAVEVDRHEHLGAVPDRGRDGRRVDREVVLADVREPGRGAGLEDGVEGGDEGER